MQATRKLRYGMVGGGRDAFIGAVHRSAAALDGQTELVAGCFSSNAEKSKASGRDLYLDENRVYSSYEEMAEKEAALPEDQRIDFVSIVTPNRMHYPVAKCFIEHGIHVVCDKPVTFNLEEAKALKKLIEDSGLVFALTHNYTGYPMVKEARERVRNGELGKLLKVVVEYPQDWLQTALEKDEQKQASWRTDPEQAGQSCCIGDIGTHAENLAHYITGLEIDSLCAEFTTFVKGRALEDDGNLLLRYKGGAKGILYASQISTGEENNLTIRVYGSEGGLEWRQEDPNKLYLSRAGQPKQILTRGNPYLSEAAQRAGRIPPGHPEAFIEAFANVYGEAVRAIRDYGANAYQGCDGYDFPTVDDGLTGMRFIETSVASAGSDAKWTKMVD
ncbi:MAG: Gfo/Idh/MocA family protein [Opitutales bacterium]